MSCVTPADLGKPIAAIVDRCGTPDLVMSLASSNQLFYAGNDGHASAIWFDADQMRARIIQFSAVPPAPSQPLADWNLTLPFESGSQEIVLGQTTLADAQSTLADSADVTTNSGAAFRSTLHNDVILSGSEHVVDAAFVGERAALVQLGFIRPPIGVPALDYQPAIPHEAWLRPQNAAKGTRGTLFRIDVDAAGIVRNVSIVIASGDAAFDAATQQRISEAEFRPATLDDRPVAGTCFVQVRH